jgi:hypothetical protein
MPRLNVSVKHNLGKEEATRRIKHLIDEMKNQIGDTVSNVQESWIDNTATFSFHVMGMAVEGALYVEPLQVQLVGKLPIAALPFKAKLQKDLECKARQLLA